MTMTELANKGRLNTSGMLPTATEIGTKGWWPYSEATAAATSAGVSIIIGLMSMVFGWGAKKRQHE